MKRTPNKNVLKHIQKLKERKRKRAKAERVLFEKRQLANFVFGLEADRSKYALLGQKLHTLSTCRQDPPYQWSSLCMTLNEMERVACEMLDYVDSEKNKEILQAEEDKQKK